MSRIFVILLVASTLAACATSRSQIRAPAPAADSAIAAPGSGPAVLIGDVVDARVFEERPPHPSTPSLGWGGAGAASADERARAVGRKRNTYGRALGDVLLEPGESVADLVREHLAAALRQAGYRVIDAPADDPAAIRVDVRIDRFWTWFQPGFWQVRLHGEITTQLSFRGRGDAIGIDVSEVDARQAAHDRAWRQILDQALTAWRAAVVARAPSFPVPPDPS